jgi:hypothetical protein
VFTYKFDTDDFLSKFKARLCVRIDLQTPSQYDTYAATLSARTFRSIIAVAAAFDLGIFQFGAVNTFINSAMEETRRVLRTRKVLAFTASFIRITDFAPALAQGVLSNASSSWFSTSGRGSLFIPKRLTLGVLLCR